MNDHPFADPPEDDPVELWGRRIGRGLAVLAALAIAYYLLSTFLR